MRILIVKTSSMGDVIHCLPIVADILKNFPGASIDWVIEEGFAEILSLSLHLNQVIPVAVRRWRKNVLRRKTWSEIAAFRNQVQAEHYDVILDMQSLFKSALLASFARGIRHGQNYKSTREPLAALFYHQTHFVPRKQHAVEQNRTLAARALDYEVPNNAPDYGLSPRLTLDSSVKLPETYIVALHATSRESKLWPTTNWIELGKTLNRQGYSLVLPWANEAERLRAEIIASGLTNAVVLPKLGLAKLGAVIAKAKAAIGVDTGLIHLAVAFNIPSVAIYTDTHPNLNGAYASQNSVAINLGGKNNSPQVSEVLNALNTLNLTKNHE